METTDTRLLADEVLTMLREIETKVFPLFPQMEPVPAEGSSMEQVFDMVSRVHEMVSAIDPKLVGKITALMENPMIQRMLG